MSTNQIKMDVRKKWEMKYRNNLEKEKILVDPKN